MKNKPIFSNQSHKYYFDNPKVWDAIREHSIDKEIQFLKQILSKYKVKDILDIGCGTGIHCQKLSELGFSVIGVDLNPAMIKYAELHHPQINFHLGDMRGLKKITFGKKFDLILCLCTTFNYNITTEEILTSLRNFNDLLVPKGLLIIEVFNPISFLEKINFRGSFFLEDPRYFRKLDLIVEVKHIVNEIKQTMTETKKVMNLKKEIIKEDLTEYRLLFPEELKFYFEYCDFTVLDQYGRYEIGYKKLDRTRMITLARKN